MVNQRIGMANLQQPVLLFILQHSMDALLKGQGKAVALTERGTDHLSLVVFADESSGIVLNDKLICVWEPQEAADCLRTFTAMSRSALSGADLQLPQSAKAGRTSISSL